MPYNAGSVGLFDPVTESFSLVGPTIPGCCKYNGGVLMPNGKVVFVPVTANDVGIFDPATDTFSTVGRSGWDEYSGGVLLLNGMVAFVPREADKVGMFDPATETFSAVGAPIMREREQRLYDGGVLLPSGKVVFVPSDGRASVGVFDPGSTAPAYSVSGGVPNAWRALLSPHFNKF